MLPKNSRRSLTVSASLMALGLLSGCGGLPVAEVGHFSPRPVPQLGQEPFAGETDSYVLSANDVVSINVFREPDLSVESIQVDPGGYVAMPLLGQIKVGGQSVTQAAATIEDRLRPGYLRDPRVTITVKGYGSHVVTVEGAVTEAGLYEFKPGMRLSGAIAMAHGTTNTSKLSEVAILRRDSEGLLIARFDYGAIAQGTMIDPVIMPNDRIVVGTSKLAQAYRDFLSTIPVLTLFYRFSRN